MDLKKGSRIAVIGAGISGIAAANILKKNGFVPVVFEKHEQIGGVWAAAYPDIHLQNIYTQYHLSDVDWSFKPDLHPTGKQIMRRQHTLPAVYRYSADGFGGNALS
jgi:dimethylaniline monooxygenase (N-oxide forming)